MGHFMFDPEWEDGCPSCSAGVDEMSDGLIEHLNTRDTSVVYVSRAPLEKLERYKQKKGWTIRWYSSYGSDFNYDFNVTVDESVKPAEYNFRSKEEHEQAGTGYYFEAEQPIEQPGTSCFLRDGDRVFHTYSTFGRGAEMLGGSYYWLDLTALGRQEEWEEPKGRSIEERSTTPDFATPDFASALQREAHGAALDLERDGHVRPRERADQALHRDRVEDGQLQRGARRGRREIEHARFCTRRTRRCPTRRP